MNKSWCLAYLRSSGSKEDDKAVYHLCPLLLIKITLCCNRYTYLDRMADLRSELNEIQLSINLMDLSKREDYYQEECSQ